MKKLLTNDTKCGIIIIESEREVNKMYEYTIENRITKEIKIVYGRNNNTVWERNNLNADEWAILNRDYID